MDMIVMYSPKAGGFFCGLRARRSRDDAEIVANTTRDPYSDQVAAWPSEEARADTLAAVCETVDGASAVIDGTGTDWVVMNRPDRTGRDTDGDRAEGIGLPPPPESDEEGGR